MATVELTVPEETTARARAFVVLALCGDNLTRAAEQSGVPRSTLFDWRAAHREEYDRVRFELAPRLEQIVIAEQYAFVVEAGHVKRALLEATRQAVADGLIPARDLPGALRNVATAEAIAVDKILAMSGRPTSVVEHRSSAELMRKLAALGAIAPVDSTATEIPAEPS